LIKLGLVTPRKRKRPKDSYQRWERPGAKYGLTNARHWAVEVKRLPAWKPSSNLRAMEMMIIVESSLPKAVASTHSDCARGVRVRTIRFGYMGPPDAKQ
jgi:hypothetical protein